MVFVDGENLVMRYQAMLALGYESTDSVIHEPGFFVWHPKISTNTLLNIVRVLYYTSVVGDENKITEAKKRIAQVNYQFDAYSFQGSAQIYPCVFKKLAQSKKTRSVDINIVIDIMRYAYSDAIDQIYLISGDGDYLTLIHEVMRRGKQVMVGALSSGLNHALVHNVDEFVDLDNFFFKSNADKGKS
jgi:uncharacterized LabA/DUF88 family protein